MTYNQKSLLDNLKKEEFASAENFMKNQEEFEKIGLEQRKPLIERYYELCPNAK